MGAPVVWFEIAGRDVAALAHFYGDLLSWRVDANNALGYGGVDTGGDGGIPGGIYAPGAETGDYVSVYAQVADLDASLAHAERLGGRTVQRPQTIPSGSRIAMILDPEGHRIGLIQPAAAEV